MLSATGKGWSRTSKTPALGTRRGAYLGSLDEVWVLIPAESIQFGYIIEI